MTKYTTPLYIWTLLTKRQLREIRCLSPSIVFYSLASVLATVYICEWQLIGKLIPIYNWRFQPKD